MKPSSDLFGEPVMAKSTPMAKPNLAKSTMALAVHAHWTAWIAHEALNVAALLNLVSDGETSISRIPDPAYALAFKLCAELRDKCVAAELQKGVGARDLLRGEVNSALWTALKPYRKQGVYDISSLSADEPF